MGVLCSVNIAILTQKWSQIEHKLNFFFRSFMNTQGCFVPSMISNYGKGHSTTACYKPLQKKICFKGEFLLKWKEETVYKTDVCWGYYFLRDMKNWTIYQMPSILLKIVVIYQTLKSVKSNSMHSSVLL